jgi:EF-P beta-lysylation protein EpmB
MDIHEKNAPPRRAPFPQLVPPHFANLIDENDPIDPLALQVAADPREHEEVPGFETDPTGDLDSRLGAGLLRKYAGRALWLVTGRCSGHCRFCFRRHYPYDEDSSNDSDPGAALDLIAKDASLEEIILSGGDPLILSDARLDRILVGLADIPHVQTLRIHTRGPVFSPGRFTPPLLAVLSQFPRRKALVAHVNHPRELDESSARVFAGLATAGYTLLSQTVLLRGVNDDAETLEALMRKLWVQGVTPYYLHQLDPVNGAAHFLVPSSTGRRLMGELRTRLAGYLVPRYVQEVPGAVSKTPL